MTTLARVLSACGALALVVGLVRCDAGIQRGYPTPDLSMDSDFDLGPPPDLSPRPAPTISAIAPPLGPNAGGTRLTLTGAGFQAGAAVTVAGAACSNVTVVSSTSVTCTTPARPKTCGAVSVMLTNPDMQAVTSDLFTYSPTALAFVPGTSVPNGAGSRSAVWADFDGDGKNDVANLSAAVAGVSSVSVQLGKGDGSFAATKQTKLTAGQDPAVMATGDLNDDGAQDLVLILNAGGVSPLVLVMLGQKDGTFKPVAGGPVALTRSSAPTAVAVATSDNKAKPFVVISGTSSGRASIDVLQNDGAGVLSMLTQTPVAGNLTSASHLVLADPNGN